MENKAIKAIVSKSNDALPILSMIAMSNGKMCATDLDVLVIVKGVSANDGIYYRDALELGFGEHTKCKDYTLEDYPEFKSEQSEEEYQMHSEDWLSIIEATKFVSKDMARPVITGVTLKDGAVYASDGYKLYKNKTTFTTSKEVTIPSACLKVLKAIKSHKYDWAIKISKDYIKFENGNLTIISKQVAATSPDYERIIGRVEYATSIELDASMIYNKKEYVDVDIKNGKAYLVNKEVRIEIPVKVEGETIKWETRDERRILMGRRVGERDHVGFDTKLLQSITGKHKVRLLVLGGMQLEVEIIK